jgi:hypothetical protein
MASCGTTSSRASVRAYASGADWSAFNSGVSLHAHTHHSREVMADLPSYIARIPVVSTYFQREVRARLEREGQEVDFSKGWWHPPVSPRVVFESEAAQIESRFELAAVISVTDHDDITAGVELQHLYAHRRAPISFEWTVPFGTGYFHLGVHNLPPESATEWFARLAAFTSASGTDELSEILSDLEKRPDLLLVFNHPLWDLADVGTASHHAALGRFLANHGAHLHALELNGYRSQVENDGVRALSIDSGIPLISGGDRHGRAANALVNVTGARTFAEFVDEVRHGVSHIVIMPEYRQHIVARKLAAASDVLRHYKSYPQGRRHWTDRISCDYEGSVRPLSHHWPGGGPLWVRSSICAFQFLTSSAVLPVIRAALEAVDGPSEGPSIPPPERLAPISMIDRREIY